MDAKLNGNEKLEKALNSFYENKNEDTLNEVLSVISDRISKEGHFIIAVNQDGEKGLVLRPVRLSDGRKYFAAYTGFEEEMKGHDPVMSGFTAQIDQLFNMTLAEEEIRGVIINPWDKPFLLDKELIKMILKI